jgi:proteasome lid subunit RPN8/RPN11
MPYITEAALMFLLEASKNYYPREFIGLLRGEGETVREVLVLPASTYGEGFASVKWSTIPIDKSIIGSIHSHPSENNKPSKKDLAYFRKTGAFHIIVAIPYRGLEDLACYDIYGERLDLQVVG